MTPARTSELRTDRVRGILVVLGLAAAAIAIWLLGSRAPDGIHIDRGIGLDKGNITNQFRTGTDSLFTLSPTGEWCVTALPTTEDLAAELPIQTQDLDIKPPSLRCTAPPLEVAIGGMNLGNVELSPNGSRLFAIGQDVAADTLTLFVMDTASLAIESYDYPSQRGRPAWVNEDEVIYYEADGWEWATPAGTVLGRIAGPPPAGAAYRIAETVYAYQTEDDNPALIKLSLRDETAIEIAPLPDLSDGGLPDRGLLMGVTPDFSHALLWSSQRTSLGLPGTSVFVYDVKRRRLVAHAPPGGALDTQTVLPFLVGDDLLAYSAAEPSGQGIGPPSVYVAPLDNADAAVEVFAGGFVMIDATTGGLLIIDNLDTFALLDVAG